MWSYIDCASQLSAPEFPTDVRLLLFSAAGSPRVLGRFELPAKDRGGAALQDTLGQAIRAHVAPTLHRGNVKQLCTAVDRAFCVVLLDPSLVNRSLHSLRSSRQEHLETCKSKSPNAIASEGEADAVDGKIQVQIVRLVTQPLSSFDSESHLCVKDIKAFAEVLQTAA